ncbi:MAG: hypothetical protein KGZ39_05600 [Simkania sp.]|nr:hypothetical protein [Simkania sp.]
MNEDFLRALGRLPRKAPELRKTPTKRKLGKVAKPMSISASKQEKERLTQEANKLGLKVSALIRKIIKDYFKEKDGPHS